jgi:ABC-type microcin C transport system permease subunit YejB
MSNRGSSYIISLSISPKLIISYLSSIGGGVIKAIQEGIVVEGVSSIICLEGTKSP